VGGDGGFRGARHKRTIIKPSSCRLSARSSTTKGTKVHEGKSIYVGLLRATSCPSWL